MSTKNKNTLKYHRTNHRPKNVKKKSFERVYWPYLPLVVVLFVVLVVSPLNHAQAIRTAARGQVLAYATSMSVSGLLQHTNNARAASGVSGLGLNAKLNAAAQNKANDMANRNYWSHNTPEGNPPWIFVEAQGYDYQKLGENLAAGFSDEQSTVNGWMNSPGHRANILDTAFSEVGFGFANNANYTSAGGGPMTIVVAFYGQPLGAAEPVDPPSCPAGQVGTPPNCSVPQVASNNAPPPSNPTPSPAPAPSQPEPAAEAPPETQPEPAAEAEAPTETKEPKDVPITTANSLENEPASKKTSYIQTVIANPNAATFAAGVLTAGMVLAAGLWISRHAMTLRRMIVRGESFVVHHPVIDITLVSFFLIAYALISQTAGVIR